MIRKIFKAWGVVIASGLLIIAAWIAKSDALMIAAAAVAGHRSAISAFQPLLFGVLLGGRRNHGYRHARP